MELNTLRMLADFCDHATYGVNAQLATIPIDAGDTRPADLAVIADETRHGQVARGRFPAARPCLTLALPDGPWGVEGEVFTVVRDTDAVKGIPVVLRLAVDSAVTEAGVAQLYYYVRAVRKCLKVFLSNEHAAARSRNSITVLQALAFQQYGVQAAVEDKILGLPMTVHFEVRDNAP